jgi:hypothetical protein
MIDEAEGMPSSSAYRARFGSLIQAYRLVGYTPRRDYRYIEINRGLRKMHPGILSSIIGELRDKGCLVCVDPGTDFISIDDEITISIVIARCRHTAAGSYRWRLRFDSGLQPDITIAVRMDAANHKPFDYFVLPKIDIASEKLRLAEENGLDLDGYRFETLDAFLEGLEPVRVTEVA